MKQLIAIASTALLALALAGCGDGSPQFVSNPPPGNNGNNMGSGKTDYTDFVKTQLAISSDSNEPASVNDKDFAFNDSDNPDAYDDVTAPGQ